MVYLEELATKNAFQVLEQKKNESQVMSTGFLQTKLTIAVHDNNDFQYETGFQFQVENSAKFYLFKSAQSLQDNAFLNHRSM